MGRHQLRGGLTLASGIRPKGVRYHTNLPVAQENACPSHTLCTGVLVQQRIFSKKYISFFVVQLHPNKDRGLRDIGPSLCQERDFQTYLNCTFFHTIKVLYLCCISGGEKGSDVLIPAEKKY